MASKKSKKVVGKDDLRRLMKETRGSIKKEAKKIDSPLAKYNSLGQLVCVVCNLQVKSELLWNAHLQGRTHKENVAALKAKVEAKNTPTVTPPSALKRKADGDVLNSNNKEAKVAKRADKKDLPDDFFDNGMAPKPLKGILKKPKLAGDYESSSDEAEEDMAIDPSAPAAAPTPVGSTNTGTVTSTLPADFFDPGVVPSTSKEVEEEEPKPQSMAEKLPEGFFDNPKEDAKVRQVEYKNKMDEEWELFTRAMKEQNVISEAIVEEEEEEKMAERKIEEIDDQLHRWSRVEHLHQKREELKSKEQEKMETADSESDIDEQEFEDFLDWRSKEAWKS